MKKIIPLSLIIISIDQIVKLIIDNNISLNSSIIIVKNFFNITYVRNNGAAFSILSGNQVFLILMAILAIFIIYKYLIKDKILTKINIFIYSILLSGIIGNLIDRVVRGYVIDYLDFKIINYNFPIFNIADICIVIGCLLLILTLKEEEDGSKSNRRKSR